MSEIVKEFVLRELRRAPVQLDTLYIVAGITAREREIGQVTKIFSYILIP